MLRFFHVLLLLPPKSSLLLLWWLTLSATIIIVTITADIGAIAVVLTHILNTNNNIATAATPNQSFSCCWRQKKNVAFIIQV